MITSLVAELRDALILEHEIRGVSDQHAAPSPAIEYVEPALALTVTVRKRERRMKLEEKQNLEVGERKRKKKRKRKLLLNSSRPCLVYSGYKFLPRSQRLFGTNSTLCLRVGGVCASALGNLGLSTHPRYLALT